MVKFDIITIFPGMFDSYLGDSLIEKAIRKKLIRVNVHNLRKWTSDRHQSVDNKPYGGGLGMVFKVEPIYRAVKEILKKSKSKKRKVVLFTPRGKKFDQKTAFKLSKLDQIVMICGRYEGVDERVARHIADMEVSIGDYDLMGGEIPAMVIVESVSRIIPGVLGKPGLLKERTTKGKSFIEYPQYTRPEVFEPKAKIKAKNPKKWKVPAVLLSGNHKKIEEWREKRGKEIGGK